MARDETIVAVVVASANRPEILGDVIADIEAQTWPVRHRVLSVPDHASLPAGGEPDGWQVVHDRGLALQRNAGIAAVPDADVIFFFDDDAVIRTDYVERALEVFARHPTVVGLTGNVLLDGAAADEVSRDAAVLELTASLDSAPSEAVRQVRSLYGCNFASRAAAAREVLFDARLPLYSWLEDHDFARRLLHLGDLVKADDCVIVHRGVKSGGRMAHRRFGYSQVMNPAYFVNKGSFTTALAAREIFRPMAKNLLFSLVGGERRWRQERLSGNVLAVCDVARRRFTPERITLL